MTFNPDAATVLDVVAACRATEDVFRRYDAAAGCRILCQALFETISGLAARFGLDRQALLADLQAVIAREGK